MGGRVLLRSVILFGEHFLSFSIYFPSSHPSLLFFGTLGLSVFLWRNGYGRGCVFVLWWGEDVRAPSFGHRSSSVRSSLGYTDNFLLSFPI